MKSIVLVPYCPLPVDSGGKMEMWKHLNILNKLGTCRIVSARNRPVGMGWTAEYEHDIRSHGFELVFREDDCKLLLRQVLGYFYGLVCKGFGLEKAFGHSNPYHRYAFPEAWWYEQTKQADIAIINYSYWAWLPCNCPKVLLLLDLWSNFMWEGPRRETREINSVDLVVVISREEEMLLNQRGVTKTLWSPPLVPVVDLPLTREIGIIGSGNKFNIEGLRWLENGVSDVDVPIRVFGNLGNYVHAPGFILNGSYQDNLQPFKECGIILLPTAAGMGMQIKAVEALAAGRAIIARKGAMRGLPPGKGAWIEVTRSSEMWAQAVKLQNDEEHREHLAQKAKRYYARYLDAFTIEEHLQKAFTNLTNRQF